MTKPPQRRLSDANRGRALAWIQDGIAQQEIGRRFGVSHSVIQWLRDRWQTASVQEPRRSGRTRSTTRQQDQFVVLSSLRDRTAPTRALQNELMNATNITICDQSILNRLREAGLRSRSAAVRPPLNPAHRLRRRQFAVNHQQWTRNQWVRVLFTDESRFTLRFNDGRIRVWRRAGERFADATVREQDQHGGGSVMVWGGFSLHHRTPPAHRPRPSDRGGIPGYHRQNPGAAGLAGGWQRRRLTR